MSQHASKAVGLFSSTPKANASSGCRKSSELELPLPKPFNTSNIERSALAAWLISSAAVAGNRIKQPIKNTATICMRSSHLLARQSMKDTLIILLRLGLQLSLGVHRDGL